jgi:hypothetical protein
MIGLMPCDLRFCVQPFVTPFAEAGKMLGRFKIIAGDFRTDMKHQVISNTLLLHEIGGWGFSATKYPSSRILELEEVSADSDRNVGGTLGWGVAGALVAGPLGAIAAGYVGGKKNDVTFVCKLDDGKQFVGVMKRSLFLELAAPFLLKKS